MRDKKFSDSNQTVTFDSDSIYDDGSRHPYLVVSIGGDSGRRFKLNRGFTTLGRSSEADISLRDDRVSRVHCLIEWMSDTIVLEDKGSTNGTIVDGQKIDRAILLPGVPFQIGHSIMKIEYKSVAEIRSEEKLLHSACFDSVTGIYNRQHFTKLAQMELSFACRYQTPIGIILLDIDNFKLINDTYGHLCGDFILAKFADIVIKNKRTEDLFGRYGGDEFIILPRGMVSKEEIFGLCENIRKAIESFEFHFDQRNVAISVSIGFDLLRSESEDVGGFLKQIIKRADQALYRAKEAGRNRTENLL